MAFNYLLLGHFLGDFVLQTDKIADNKGKQWQWNLLHVLVVTFCTIMLSYQFGILMLCLVVLNGGIHFVLDYYKGYIAKVLRLSELAGFLLDQFIHIVILYAISLTASYGQNSHLINLITAKYLVVLVMVTSFAAVLNQFILTALFPRAEKKFFEDGEKQIGILTRLFMAVVFYLSVFLSPFYLFLLLILFASVYLFHFILRRKKWRSLLYMSVKFLLDAVVAAAGIFAIYYFS